MSQTTVLRRAALAGLAGLAGAAGVLVTAAPAQAVTFVGTHTLRPRNELGVLRTAAVFPNPGPASVTVATGAGFSGHWNMFNQPANGFGGVFLKHRVAGLCLDTGDGSSATSVSVRGCDNTISQNWTMITVPGTGFNSGIFTIQNKFTGRYLTKVAGSVSPTLEPFSGSTNQHWVDTLVEG